MFHQDAKPPRRSLLLPRGVPRETDAEKLPVVFESALRRDVERAIRPSCMQANHAARADGVADAEFVKYIRIEDRDIGKNEVRRHQLGEHVLEDVSGAFLVIGSKWLKTRRFERRTEELFIDVVEIDLKRFVLLRRLPAIESIRGFFGTSFFPKRHDHEDATPEARPGRCHGAITASRPSLNKENSFPRPATARLLRPAPNENS